jgi:hypothetical protein
MYDPLVAAIDRGAGVRLPVEDLRQLSLQHDEETPDRAPLAELFTATVAGHHEPQAWTGDDLTRRATLRLLARSWQLNPGAKTWNEAFASAVAYGAAARQDRLLAEEERTSVWRGTVLRHHSVGAWRSLWAALVKEVSRAGLASRVHLHEWISEQLPGSTVSAFERGLPPVEDAHGDPLPAENGLMTSEALVSGTVAVLLLGAQRLATLAGVTLTAFAGRRRTYLDPVWVDHLRREFAGRPLAELGRRLVDDMLAQSRRVALRKVKLNRDGTLLIFSRLHERNGLYFADSSEGSGNIGLRLPQLADHATQLGLLSRDPREPVTSLGIDWLELPR